MLFREALKTGCYDLQKARDTYRSFVQEEGMHHDLALQYAEVCSPQYVGSVFHQPAKSKRTAAMWASVRAGCRQLLGQRSRGQPTPAFARLLPEVSDYHKLAKLDMHSSTQVATLLLTPICPHTCEHMWRAILGRPGSVLTAGFPAGRAPDFALKFAAEYLHEEVADLRKLIEKAEAPPKSKKKITPPPPPPAKVTSSSSVSLMAGAQSPQPFVAHSIYAAGS